MKRKSRKIRIRKSTFKTVVALSAGLVTEVTILSVFPFGYAGVSAKNGKNSVINDNINVEFILPEENANIDNVPAYKNDFNLGFKIDGKNVLIESIRMTDSQNVNEEFLYSRNISFEYPDYENNEEDFDEDENDEDEGDDENNDIDENKNDDEENGKDKDNSEEENGNDNDKSKDEENENDNDNDENENNCNENNNGENEGGNDENEGSNNDGQGGNNDTSGNENENSSGDEDINDNENNDNENNNDNAGDGAGGSDDNGNENNNNNQSDDENNNDGMNDNDNNSDDNQNNNENGNGDNNNSQDENNNEDDNENNNSGNENNNENDDVSGSSDESGDDNNNNQSNDENNNEDKKENDGNKNDNKEEKKKRDEENRKKKTEEYLLLNYPEFSQTTEINLQDVALIGGDGKHTIKLYVDYYEKSDVFENLLKGQKENIVAKTETFEKNFIIDKTAPVINFKFEDSQTGNIFNHSRKAYLDIVDDYSDINNSFIIINGERKKIKKEITFDKDGRYKVVITAKDLLGNETSVQINEFVIDTKAPEIEVRIVDEEKKYTNKKRKAYAWISDENLVGDRLNIYTFKEGEDSFKIKAYDSAGNASEYESKVFIQDYTAPSGKIRGIFNGENKNGKLEISFWGNDKWFDSKESYIEITGTNDEEIYRFEFESKDKENVISIEDEDKMPDDYYTMKWVLFDKAGNKSEDSLSFVLNRKGSEFNVDEKLKSVIGTELESISDVCIEERNISRINAEETKIFFAINGRINDIIKEKDYFVEESFDLSGYKYLYRFNDKLFENEGVYTISLLTFDVAGNINDTRLNKDFEDIKFGIRKNKKEITEVIFEDNRQEATIDKNIETTGDNNTEFIHKEKEKDNIITKEDQKEIEDYVVTFAESDKEKKENVLSVYHSKKRKMFIFICITGSIAFLAAVIRAIMAKTKNNEKNTKNS